MDALNNTIAVAHRAFELYWHAYVNNLPTRNARIADHNKAIAARLKAEKAYRAESERRSVLLNKQEVTEVCRRCLVRIIPLLKKLPQEIAPRLNPNDPILAEKILQRSVDQILVAAQQAISELTAI